MLDCEGVYYYFYKNVLITLPQFMFAFRCGFSGQSIFDDEYMAWYNAVITTWPIAAKVLFSYDINSKIDRAEYVSQLPCLYYDSQFGLNFSQIKFCLVLVRSVAQASIIFFVPFFVLDGTSIVGGLSGSPTDQWTMSLAIYYSVFTVVTINLII